MFPIQPYPKRILLLFALIFLSLTACKTTTEITKEEYLEDTDWRIEKIITDSGKTIDFEKYHFKPIIAYKDSFIHYVIPLNKKESIDNPSGVIEDSVNINDVHSLYVKKFSALATTGCLLGGAVGAIAVIVATKESCPFIYSFDGKQYIFDGEPYGGAICEALKRTDYSLLEHLKQTNGKYKILLSNQVDETQYTDELKLLVVDHEKNTAVVPDYNDNFLTLENSLLPIRASDQKGDDILKFLEKDDLFLWKSDFDYPLERQTWRDSIYLTFPKPVNATSVKFVFDVGTTLWGSQMLKRTSELRGNKVKEWYSSLNNPMIKSQLEAWNLREEVYKLKVNVKVGERWITKGIILGGGPFITEKRVITLNISDVKGENLDIMLTPPIGFWTFNYFAVDYSKQRQIYITELNPNAVKSSNDKEITELLSSVDSRYYIEPVKGQQVNLEFKAPKTRKGFNRAVFAKTTGYYDIHLDKSVPANFAILNKIAFEPGYIVKYSNSQYLNWKKEIASTQN